MDTYSHTLELTIHYPQQPWPHLRSISPSQPLLLPTPSWLLNCPLLVSGSKFWDMIVLTGGFHWSSLSTYLPTIYLPIIYLSSLSIYLPLTSFVSLGKKADEYRCQSPQKSNRHTPTLHANAKQSCSFEEGWARCAVFGQPKGLAEPEQAPKGNLPL